MKCWLWPDHAIGKRESARLREEHNAAVNVAAELRAALELVNVDKDGDGFICAEGMDQVRAALAKARGA